MRLRLGRCRVSINFYFFVLIALVGAYGGNELLSGISAAGIHECGHILAVYLCTSGANPISFDITPFGMRMGVIPVCIERRHELIILSGGIAANLISAAVFWVLGTALKSGAMFRQSAAGICMAAVNAAAVHPLDGGRILELLLESRFDTVKADRAVFIISLITLFFMALAGFMILLRNRGNFSLLLLSLWLAVRCLRGDTGV